MTKHQKDLENSRGLALIAVLWLVAAMGLIITGVVKSVRTETASSGQQRQSLQVQTTADAVILLALQTLFARDIPITLASETITVKFDGKDHAIQVLSLNGLIDINKAPVTLLTQLYEVSGGLANNAAVALAQSTIQTRETPNSKGVAAKFEAKEDLLRVPGMTYDLYAMIENLVTADLKDGSGRVNPLAAPLSVIQVLTGGDSARASVLYANRNVPLTGMDTTVFNPDFISNSVSRSIRLRVDLPLSEKQMMSRQWDVFRTNDRRTGLPWKMLSKSHTFTKISAEN